MPDRLPCEFFLVRYVPDVVKGEFVNIGVLLRVAAGAGGAVSGTSGDAASGSSATQVRFTRDWARVRCMDRDADTELLEALEGEIAGRLRMGTSARDPRAVLDVLEDSLSNSVQITAPRATLAESLPAQMDELMRLYVEPMRVPRTRTRSGRAQIQAGLRTSFERAGVWALMRKRIAASTYTRPGDPLRLDCGYRTTADKDPRVRILQAVSLEGDVEAAKGLAWAAPRLRAGVTRVEGVELELTAVVEPLLAVTEDAAEGEAFDRYRFGVEAMERELIRVITVNDLARAAATARHELGL